MLSTTNQTGAIVAGIASATIIIVCICIIVFQGNLPFTFSCRKTPTSIYDAEEEDLEFTDSLYEKYGGLYVGPDKQPTVAALDIMTRMLIGTCLGSCTKASGTTMCEKPTETAPQLKVELLNSTFDVSAPAIIVVETDVPAPKDERSITNKRDAQHGCRAELIRAGQWADVAKESIRSECEEIMLDPMSFSFGSERSMAELYRKEW
jgi:hypothetical protein